MKFTISTQEFNYLISKCLNVVSQKPTSPILSNILIEAVNDELILTATDLTVGVRCFTEAKILEEGATTVSAKRLSQLVRELTSTNLEISTNENEVMEIISDSSLFKLNGMNKREFPTFPAVSEAVHFKIGHQELKDMFFATAFAVSREDSRYVLSGISMDIVDGCLVFVGTDGKKLARAQSKINIDPSFTTHLVIPLKAVEEITKNLNAEGDANVFLMKDKIAVEASNTMIVTKLLTGDYPDINQVIPQETKTKVILHREELMVLLRQVALFVPDTSCPIRFTFSDGELHLMANTMEIGEGKVSMPANYHGPKLEIAFNPHFFLDILRHSKGETVLVGITDEYNPGTISETQKESTPNPSPLFVLMPMRLA